MSFPTLLILAVAALALVGGIAAVLWLELRRGRLRGQLRKRLEATPRVRAGEAHSGLVVVEGTAVPVDRPLRAPVSGRAVIGYRLVVETTDPETLGSSGVEGLWNVVVDEAVMGDFRIKDETGEVDVLATGARIFLERERRQKTGLFKDAPPALKPLLRQAQLTIGGRGISLRGGQPVYMRLRWSEYLLEPGEWVTVYGNACTMLDPSRAGGGYRDAPRRRVIRAPARDPVIVADTPLVALLEELR